jgi:hypothetical protein
MKPAAKEYIQKFRMAKNKKISSSSSLPNIKKESMNKPTYKECLMKGMDPLDSEYIDWKLEEKIEIISPQWKIDIKEEILKEVKREMHERFEELKKEYNAKFDISFSDEEHMMDIMGTTKSQINNQEERDLSESTPSSLVVLSNPPCNIEEAIIRIPATR